MNTNTATSMRDNGPLPTAAATLYNGTVMHARMKPAVHRFDYKVFSLLIDLDKLKEADRQSRFFSVRRFNLVSFHPKDHGPRDGKDLRKHIDALLTDKGLERPARVLLLAYPRILGTVFNPLAVYYAYDIDGHLAAVIYEVRNTFGDLHQYVIPVTDGQMSEAGLRQDQEKLFYVSPFIDMEQHYHFRLLPPGKSVRIRILETDPEGPLLSATFIGNALPMTSLALVKLCFKIPFLTFKILGGIHWEAFKIWRKRVRFYPRPAKGASAPSPSITQTAR
ncbi:DUF1365 domain-containing protein [Roseibium algae]|uniref:DUF1365 domain-containing protein n=1 Tax=Roseibium algae TaxID=3123038 RepID=A0ABU8TJQ8_9HYPH